MFFLKVVSFLLFINLLNGFNPNIIHKSNNRIFMGCDYYIEKNLCIYYTDDSSYCLTLERERGYYSDYDDFIIDMMDNSEKISEWEKMKECHLIPREMPTVIYANNTFSNIYVANEYGRMIESQIINNHCKTWDDVKEIVILEERYPRD